MENPNQSPSRRSFLRAAAGAACLASSASLVTRMAAQSPESHVDILLNEPVGAIAPEIYGHFVEHLGGVVYDGIWVGENSTHPQRQRTPQTAGGCPQARQARHDSLARRLLRRPVRLARRHRPPRQASQAHQLLGGLARVAEETPKRDGPQSYDPNLFGTVDFARFCKRRGRAALLRRQPAQPSRAGVLALGGVLQLARRIPAPWPPSAPPTASPNPSACATGASATNPGAAAATSIPRITAPNSIATPPGFPPTACSPG